MATSTVGRRVPAWAVVLLGVLAGTLVALLAFGGAAQAQPTGSHDLSITKRPKQAPDLRRGQLFTWTVRVTNQRGGVARSVVVVDNLPNFMRFVRARTSLREPGICNPINNRRGVVCRLGNLRVGDRVTIRVTGRVVSLGSDLNRASVRAGGRTGGGFGADLEPSDNRDTTRHRAVKGRDGGKDRCGGVQAESRRDGAKACVGGVKARANN